VVKGELKMIELQQVDSDEPEEQAQTEKADNREIFTETQAQRLEHEEIKFLKK